MANVSTQIKNWSATAASNQPDGVDAATIAGDLQAIQAGVRNLYSQDTIASATTCDLGTKDAESLTISGTTTITSLGTVSAGIVKRVVFSGALTLTYNAASLILPGNANIITVAGDTAEFESLGAGNWRCNFYQHDAGNAAAGANSDITEITGLTTALSIAQGGSGSATAFANSLASSGYQKLPGGLIIQWGIGTISASTSVVITYPIAFTAAAYITIPSNRSGASSSFVFSSNVGSATQFTIYASSTTTISAAWLAIGY